MGCDYRAKQSLSLLTSMAFQHAYVSYVCILAGCMTFELWSPWFSGVGVDEGCFSPTAEGQAHAETQAACRPAQPDTDICQASFEQSA